ncbi:toxin-antitoxin system, toxin component domain protein [Leptospira interrogans serovar Grippotyphosa str. LT2186]|uniref:Toxin-antitoxin system, toxin component domain protein n=1 Tax=Leptospira interrogans serovar Grippotyphosa str. LT2186 TaxID=1001599 RepID=M3GRC6_LEPIR|nr:toxin-antitoxin system, toxin component domain protein [Leptospira interrogans serovar Grippotyphosa str. UI 08368]EMG09193.1 toxin-antitoxin system, toxin component domain protein [Leptospira interrogans serovar Grippotyphosa str. LT2186]EMN86845.1 toxin-antitoxin system, toxin component domain protein [Leptospira interrogans serovar Grippotyphosa str. UI 12769]EMO92229.1 toxin-antitoxin system, toxin component domain protein [Leptospira interrogans str. UI 13372]
MDLILIADTKIPFLNRPESFPELLSLPVELNLFYLQRRKMGKNP